MESNATAEKPKRYLALYDFDDVQEGELGFKEGDTLWAITIPDSTDWLYAQNSAGQFGNIPANFVQATSTPVKAKKPPPPPPTQESKEKLQPPTPAPGDAAQPSAADPVEDQQPTTNNKKSWKPPPPKTKKKKKTGGRTASSRNSSVNIRNSSKELGKLITFRLPKGSLGLRLAVVNNSVTVGRVTPGSAAQIVGLQPGDALISFNGTVLTNLSKEDAKAEIGACATKGERVLVIRRPEGTLTSSSSTTIGRNGKSRKNSRSHRGHIAKSAPNFRRVTKGSHAPDSQRMFKRMTSSITVVREPPDSEDGQVMHSSALEQLKGERIHMQVENVEYQNPFFSQVGVSVLIILRWSDYKCLFKFFVCPSLQLRPMNEENSLSRTIK